MTDKQQQSQGIHSKNVTVNDDDTITLTLSTGRTISITVITPTEGQGTWLSSAYHQLSLGQEAWQDGEMDFSDSAHFAHLLLKVVYMLVESKKTVTQIDDALAGGKIDIADLSALMFEAFTVIERRKNDANVIEANGK